MPPVSPARQEWRKSVGREGAFSVGAQDVGGGSESEYRTACLRACGTCWEPRGRGNWSWVAGEYSCGTSCRPDDERPPMGNWFICSAWRGQHRSESDSHPPLSQPCGDTYASSVTAYGAQTQHASGGHGSLATELGTWGCTHIQVCRPSQGTCRRKVQRSWKWGPQWGVGTTLKTPSPGTQQMLPNHFSGMW